MQKVTKSSFGVFKWPVLTLLFLTVVLASGRTPSHYEVINNKPSTLDTLRAKNSLILTKIQEQIKAYELTTKHK